MANTRKFPDPATLADHCDAGMSPAQIGEAYDCTPDSARRKLLSLGLIERGAKASAARPASRSKRGVFLHPDRITFMRDTAGPEGGLEVRPMSLPRIGMFLAALAAKKVKVTEVRNAVR